MSQDIIITDKKISHDQLKAQCDRWFGDMVKLAVDVERCVVAVGGDLHADGEALLIKDGSNPDDIWGANLYPLNDPNDRIEYTALINIRARRENPSMEILDPGIRERMKQIVESLIMGPDEKLV